MAHFICENIKQLKQEIGNTQLVAVSKYRNIAELEEVYACGHRDLGENRVQEMVDKYHTLPKDIRWHLIGHLQTNKVKYIAPFVHMIHAVDSLKLLRTINKEAKKADRIIPFLFQIHIAEEDSKYGINPREFQEIFEGYKSENLINVKCVGLMGMATNTPNSNQVKQEFGQLKALYEKYKQVNNWHTLSMGMSGDYAIAIDSGSTTIRVGSKLFEDS